jgi:hypothetical protein
VAFSRYTFTLRNQSGLGLITPESADSIYQAVKSGALLVSPYMLKESERLDHVAASRLGDSSLWWVLAATSGIGWGLQCPPGTLINIPDNMETVYRIVRSG